MSERVGWSRLRRLTERAYHLALHRYPAALRHRFGSRMAEDVRHLLEEEVARAGLLGWLRACARIARDLVRPLPAVPGAARGRAGAPVGWPGARIVAETFHGAWRALARRPAFTLLVVGILGAGIALNAAIFAVVDAYLLRPLPYPAAERLVQVRPATSAVGWTNSEDVFEKAVSWNLDGFTLVGGEGSEVVLGARVSPDFFDVYGVRPEIGRGFLSEDGGKGAAAVAVISHRLWMRRFSGDPTVLGTTLRAYSSEEQDDLHSYTIVGVLPADFWYLNGYTDVLTPLAAPGPVYVGRLRTDVPPERAETIVTERARAAGLLAPDDGPVRLRPLGDAYAASVRPQLLALQAAALLVLLAACASAALLVLVRANGRGREMNVRMALGAGRRRLAAYVLGEGAILSLLSGIVGAVLGWGGLRLLAEVIEARVGRAVPGGTAALRMDGAVVLGLVGLGAVVAFALGSVPLWGRAGRRLGAVAHGGGRGATESGGARRARDVLVAAEVALALALSSGGALLVRSALHLQRADLGFEPHGLEIYTVGYSSAGSEDPERRASFFRSLVEGAARLDGATAAGLARRAPFGGALVARALQVEGEAGTAAPPEAVPQVASPEYFPALGVRPLRGRLFGADDRPGTSPVAVVSASLAARIRPGGDALGARIRFPAWDMLSMEEAPGPWRTVVGVVPDLIEGLDGTRPTVWAPYAQTPIAWMDLVVRRRPDAPSLAEQVRALVRDLDEDTPLYAATDLPSALKRARAPSRFFATLLAAFSLFSLGLAMLGLYGVAAYAARRRRRDLAVRMALGARRGAVERLFVREAAGTVALGIAFGLVGGRALSTALEGQLHGVRADDPATAVTMAVLVAATALLAVWLPARSAARLDVSAILREE